MSENTFHSMLHRLSSRATPATIIDVGASTGIWSRMAMEFWPEARYLLIEADKRHYQALDAFCVEDPEHRRAIKAMAGPTFGNGNFASDPNDPWGGQGSLTGNAMTATVPQVTIDSMGPHRSRAIPALIKLDTHGFEIPILQGAARTLQTACAVIIEAYTCTLQPGAVRFWELCQYMAFAGFTCTDMADPMRRELDGRLWQFDLCFERSDAHMVGEARFR